MYNNDLLFPSKDFFSYMYRLFCYQSILSFFFFVVYSLTLYKVVGNYFPSPDFEIHTRHFLLYFSSFHLMTKIGENFRKKKLFECFGGFLRLNVYFSCPIKGYRIINKKTQRICNSRERVKKGVKM